VNQVVRSSFFLSPTFLLYGDRGGWGTVLGALTQITYRLGNCARSQLLVAAAVMRCTTTRGSERPHQSKKCFSQSWQSDVAPWPAK
jgi:hypothetical protein